MKGARAKKAAEVAEGQASSEIIPNPIPPKEPRTSAARPGPGPALQSQEDVQINGEVFKKICGQLRTNELLGPSAADALEAAAGLRSPASPQCKAARELRTKVADGRGVMVFGGHEEIPEVAESTTKKRQSFQSEEVDENHDAETITSHPEKDAPEPPELNLSPKQNHMRTDLEMWIMDEILEVFGVDDSDDLDGDELREDGQATKITQLIAEEDADKHKSMLQSWLSSAKDNDAKDAFITKILEKIGQIQALGPKKKKKKKNKNAV